MQIKASLTNSAKIDSAETTSAQGTDAMPASQNTPAATKLSLGVANTADRFESLPGTESSSKSKPEPPPPKSTSDQLSVTGEAPAKTAPTIDFSKMSVEDAMMLMFRMISNDAKKD